MLGIYRYILGMHRKYNKKDKRWTLTVTTSPSANANSSGLRGSKE